MHSAFCAGTHIGILLPLWPKAVPIQEVASITCTCAYKLSPPPPFWYNTLVLPPYPTLVDSQRSCHSFSSPFGTSFHFVLSLTVVQIQRDILKKSSGPLLRTLLVGECQHTKLAKIVIKCGISCALSATVLCPLVCRCTLRRPPLVKWSAMQASVARTLLFLGCVCACAWSVVSFFFCFFVRAAAQRTSMSREWFYILWAAMHVYV